MSLECWPAAIGARRRHHRHHHFEGTPPRKGTLAPDDRGQPGLRALYAGKKMPPPIFIWSARRANLGRGGFAQGVPSASTGASAPPAVLDQKGCSIRPHSRHPNRPEAHCENSDRAFTMCTRCPRTTRIQPGADARRRGFDLHLDNPSLSSSSSAMCTIGCMPGSACLIIPILP